MLCLKNIVFGAVITALHLRTFEHEEEHRPQPPIKELETGEQTWSVNSMWNFIMEQYGVPIAHYVVSATYSVYVRLTVINVLIFLLKHVPTGLYMYKRVKDMYVTSRERIKQIQTKIEDIQLEIQILNTKERVREAEFSERTEQLRRATERLRRVRAVLAVIAAKDALRRARDGAAACDSDHDMHGDAPPEGDREFIVELIKELKFEHMVIPERHSEKTDKSSAGDADVKPDCRVKIVKVTNVYKIAYLKRLRRANKQALLMKKKMEGIKKMFEDWQKTLDMVINSKLTRLNIDPHPMDVESQDAMGDYSKPHEASDTDSDFRNSCTDMRYDEYATLSWTQIPYKPFTYNYEDVSETSREHFETQDFGDVRSLAQPACEHGKGSNMVSIVEETSTQIAIEEIKSECGEDYECRDLVVL